MGLGMGQSGFRGHLGPAGMRGRDLGPGSSSDHCGKQPLLLAWVGLWPSSPGSLLPPFLAAPSFLVVWPFDVRAEGPRGSLAKVIVGWWQLQGSVSALFGALRAARSVGWVRWSPGLLEDAATWFLTSCLGPTFQPWRRWDREDARSCWVQVEALFHWGVGEG